MFMRPKVEFKQPYFVTPHAVKRFQERVANLPEHDVILVVQAALQVKRDPAWTFKLRDGRLCLVYAAMYRGIRYYIPTFQENRGREPGETWPVVPTVLGPDMGEKPEKSKEEIESAKPETL